MSTSFKNRVYGAVVIKSINSNYNADFSGQPRKLPNGVVYATDKALKYSIRNYWKNALGESVFYFKSLNENLAPRDLKETYEVKYKDIKNDKVDVLANLLQSIDVRLFGGTFAVKSVNLSLHGTCQITHGVNKFSENVIYTEQILSPFRNSNKEDADNSTLGSQSRLEEGHYVHHFSVNPKNIEEDAERVKSAGVLVEDIAKLKEGMCKGASYYDSAAKSGTENELLLWVELKEGSKVVLPSFVNLIDINDSREIDLQKVQALLKEEHIAKDVLKIELFYNKTLTKVINEPIGATVLAI
ncbi:type I CRISPR-associated protein Cas7 [Myroides odoratimimus]|uniref:CRISPR-associated protein n=2 Tax=Myroides odoratimimus TaxID=76832 RepID=A0A0S7EEQ6_9FLAO|nr:type I CRISPR-associated protein Cas7 [Myroides odoratimimus]ALU27792.1 CRISPR-associated protein [Myroides odoratimimus]EHO09811.1 ct1132 family CRISPR-associated protein [Myroides odoratimimus CCUG 10230]MDM1039114.1 type I CRISPR-associated protein Cas7 [Myroides odoratimimus]MDM1053259.1 type I CRISPR-associated protein Cas7 [Myroides odoratimimus]MDM1059702.1 type I CRISPR-associated protein Cas7 [Myroides odoratimimus]